MKHPDLHIDAALLASCAEQEAVQWLKNNQATPLALCRNKRNDVLEKILVRRNSPYLDLGIAKYGSCPPCLRKVYSRAVLGTRCAALKNPTVGPFIPGGVYAGWLDISEMVSLLGSKRHVEQMALLSNAKLHDKVLLEVLERSDHFEDIDEVRFGTLVQFMIENPRFSERYSGGFDGFAEYDHGRLVEAAWKLAENVPVCAWWASVLSSFLANCGDPNEGTEVLIRRWNNPDKEPSDESGLSPFYRIRSELARGITMLPPLSEHPDPAIRSRFYLSYDPDTVGSSFYARIPTEGLDYHKIQELTAEAKSWEPCQVYEVDGIDGVMDVLKNDYYWRKRDRRRSLWDLATAIENNEDSIFALNLHRGMEDRMREEKPEYFKDDDKEGYDQLAEKFHSQSALLEEREGVLAERERELESARNQATEAKKALRSLKNEKKAEIQDIKKKLDEAEKQNRKGFGSKLSRIFGKGGG